MATGERPFTRGKLGLHDDEAYEQALLTSDTLVAQTYDELQHDRSEVYDTLRTRAEDIGQIELREHELARVGLAKQSLDVFFGVTEFRARSAVDTQVADLSRDKKDNFFRFYMDTLTNFAGESLYRREVESAEARQHVIQLSRRYGKVLLSSYVLRYGDDRLADMRLAMAQSQARPRYLAGKAKLFAPATIEEGRDEVIDAVSGPIYTILQDAA